MRNAIIALVFIFLLVTVIWIYRHFFEFNNSVVESYINSEASKYEEEAQAKKIITDGVNHILSSYTLTKQVRDYAKATNLEVERVLVDAAVIQGKALNYL